MKKKCASPDSDPDRDPDAVDAVKPGSGYLPLPLRNARRETSPQFASPQRAGPSPSPGPGHDNDENDAVKIKKFAFYDR